MSIGIDYKFELAGGRTLVPRIDIIAVGPSFGNIFNGAVNRIPAYSRVNAQIQLNGHDDRWFVRVFVKNLANSSAITGISVADQAQGLATNVFLLEPRHSGWPREYDQRAPFTPGPDFRHDPIADIKPLSPCYALAQTRRRYGPQRAAWTSDLASRAGKSPARRHRRSGADGCARGVGGTTSRNDHRDTMTMGPSATSLSSWSRRSRRPFHQQTHAIAMSSAATILTFVAVLSFANLGFLAVCLFLAMLAANLNTSALGGWFGSVLPKEQDAPLGAWFAAVTFGGFGLASILGIELIHHAPLWLAATILAAMNLPPLAILLSVSCPADERSRLTESFARFSRELIELARRSDFRRLSLLLILPCTAFALTTTLGGLGRDYHASETLIATIGWVGVTAAGIFGSLTVPALGRRAGLITVYLGIGIIGGPRRFRSLASDLPRSTQLVLWPRTSGSRPGSPRALPLILSSIQRTIRSLRLSSPSSMPRSRHPSSTCNGSTDTHMALGADRSLPDRRKPGFGVLRGDDRAIPAVVETVQRCSGAFHCIACRSLTPRGLTG